MFKWAVIDNNQVINIINADTKDIAESATGKSCYQILDGQDIRIGSSYNSSTNTFILPDQKIKPVLVPKIDPVPEHLLDQIPAGETLDVSITGYYKDQNGNIVQEPQSISNINQIN